MERSRSSLTTSNTIELRAAKSSDPSAIQQQNNHNSELSSEKMTIPVLGYPLTSQNSRVSNLSGDLHINRLATISYGGAGHETYNSEVDSLISKAYRQIFFHAMSSDREPFLESQLRNGEITVRDFIRGLLVSRRFSEGYFNCSSNYRMVDQVVGRALGRPVHGEAERRSWSIVIAEKGFKAFIDQILDSDEYMSSFGYDRIPEQRSRKLPGQSIGEMPIYQRFPRYGSDWRDSLQNRAPSAQFGRQAAQAMQASTVWASGEPPAWAVKLWLGLFAVGGIELIRIFITVAAEMLKTGQG